MDSDGIFEDIENDDLSLSDDEPKVKKRVKRKGKEKSEHLVISLTRARQRFIIISYRL